MAIGADSGKGKCCIGFRNQYFEFEWNVEDWDWDLALSKMEESQEGGGLSLSGLFETYFCIPKPNPCELHAAFASWAPQPWQRINGSQLNYTPGPAVWLTTGALAFLQFPPKPQDCWNISCLHSDIVFITANFHAAPSIAIWSHLKLTWQVCIWNWLLLCGCWYSIYTVT